MDRHIAKLNEEIESAMAGLSAEQLSRHPDGKWCVAEILEHLYLTYTGTTLGFQRVIKAGKSLARRATLADRARTFVVVGVGYLPTGRKSPVIAVPHGMPVDTVLAGIGSKLAEMDAVMSSCATQFGARTRLLDHPFLGPMSVEQWRKLHFLHGVHHLKQIRRLIKNID